MLQFPIDKRTGGRRTRGHRYTFPIFPLFLLAALVFAATAPAAWAQDDETGDGGELPFKKTEFIIELTDNDIEIQSNIDGNEWKSLKISDPNGRTIFSTRTGGRLRIQGMSEMHWASEPSHYLEDEPDFDESIESFLARFPEGEYEFEARTITGEELEGIATFTHVLPALPEVTAPLSETDEPPVVDPNNAVIAWEPVTETFTGSTDLEIVAYQVIVEQVEPFRNSMVNLPSTATSYTVSPDFLEPGALYDFEVVAFEAGGNVTISTGEFTTP